MSEQVKKLVPKLRFPEYSSSNEWSLEKLGEIFSERVERGGNLPLLSLTEKDGIVRQDETNRKNNSSEDKSRYLKVCVGDVAYNTMRMWEGRSAYANLEGLVSPAYTICKPNKNNLGVYFSYLFKTDALIRLFHRFSQGLVSDTLNLKYEAFAKISILNTNKNEQQKIADCLSSLDDLITAQNQKVEALKQHKKGLMQQLFPAEGETVPKLRFPEFENEPWHIKPLGKVADNLDFKRVPITESDRKKGAIPYYGASGIIDYVDGYIFDEDLLCISEDGANLVARTYPIAFSISGKTWVNNHAHVLKFKKKFTQIIIENYLNSISLEDYLTGMAQPKLNQAKLEIIPIPLPENENEQQKIANFLSSIDELITTQSQQLEAYKTHKKGLMQQLFPALEESTL